MSIATRIAQEINTVRSEIDGKEDSLGFTPEDAANKGSANGYPELDATGKIPAGQQTSGTVVDAAYVHTDNNYTTTEKNKLGGVEAGATADQTASEIEGLYEGIANTNKYTDTEKTKVGNIPADTIQDIADINALLTSDDTTLDELQEVVNFIKQNKNDLDTLTMANIAETASVKYYTLVEKNKLAGIADNANNYVHPTAAGSKHIPSGGSTGDVLKWSADGTATWGTDINTNTWRGIDNVPVNGQTAESISSNWAYDHTTSSTAHPRDTRSQIAGSYAAAVHLHDYLPLTGGTVTGDVRVTSNLDVIGTGTNTDHVITLAETEGQYGTKFGYYGAGDNYFRWYTRENNVDIEVWNHARGSTTVNFAGNLGVVGTVDGRDVSADGAKLDGIATNANNYAHPTYSGDDFSVDTGALSGATVVSDIDINVTTDASGHVTDANGTVATRTLTLADLGYTGATNANNYTYTHPTYAGDDLSVDTDVLSGATVISDLDFNVTTDTQGHVTDANATYATRNLTYTDVGAQPAGTYNTVIGTDTDVNTSGATIIDNIYMTDGVITSHGTRNLTLADLGYTGETNATADQTAPEILTAIKTVDGSGSGLDADLLDGLQASQFLRGDTSDTINGDLTVIGKVNMSNNFVINKPFSMIENASPQWILLCVNGANNDVNGRIQIDRTSGNYQSAIIDIVVTSGTTAMYGGALRTLQVLQTSEEYRLVSVTYSGVDYIAIKYSGNTYPNTTASYFTGRLASTGSSLVVVSSGITNEISFGGNTESYNEVDNFIVSGNITTNGHPVWTSGNDGSGSGLDSDKLDGQEGSYYLDASNISAGTINDARLPSSITSSITGNAGTATKLATARTIALSGDVTGSTTFDGSGNTTITATVANDSHTHDGRYYTEAESNAKYLALSGGTMTGRIIADTPLDYDSTSITSMTNAPIYYPSVSVGTSNSFLPALHMSAVHSGGYRTHMNVGLYKNTSGWGEGETGFYVGLGGSDSYPTEYFRMTKGGNIKHSNGYTFWHSGNDGSGSGLDADTVDGIHASGLARMAVSTYDQLLPSQGTWLRAPSSGFLPSANNVGVLGTSSWRFSSAYINTVYGNLSGNASTATTATNADKLDNLDSTQFLRSDIDDTFTGNELNVLNTLQWKVGSSDNALQRADARDDATNYSRLHWYGESDSGSTSNFRHAWYDGSSYVNIDVSGGGIDFTGSASHMTIGGNTVYHSGNIPTWNQNTTGNASTATWADSVDVNSGNTSATWYDVVWHSGDTVYSSAGVEIQGSTNSLRASNLYATDMYVDDQIFSTGDTNTYLQFHAADQWRVVTGGSERLEVNNSAITTPLNINANGGLTLDGTKVFNGFDTWFRPRTGQGLVDATNATGIHSSASKRMAIYSDGGLDIDHTGSDALRVKGGIQLGTAREATIEYNSVDNSIDFIIN